MSTTIEWTDETWNPVVGCSKISEGCRNCYAEGVAHRFGFTPKPWTAANAAENVILHPERLDEPMKWRKSRRVFVNSMCDLFHEQVPFHFIRAVWSRMAQAPQHTFQVLTKRPSRMLEFVKWMGDQEFRVEIALPNVWIGVSVEDQRAADERILLLLQMPATVRFLSCEPLLGPVDLLKDNDILCRCEGCMTMAKEHPDSPGLQRIDWVIVGGESGAGARPMHPQWVKDIRDQCLPAGVPFFFKQWGEFAPYVDESKYTHGETETNRNCQTYVNPDGSIGSCWVYDDDGTFQNWTGEPADGCHIVNRVGKKRAGRLNH